MNQEDPERPLSALEVWLKGHVHLAGHNSFAGTLAIQAGLTRTEIRLVVAFAKNPWGMLTLDEIARVLGWPEGMSLVAWRSSASHFANLKRKGVEFQVVRRVGGGRPLGRAFVWSEVFTAPVQGPKRNRAWSMKRPRYGRVPLADSLVAQVLDAYRRRHDLTQEQVAARLGVTRAAVTGWTSARKMPGDRVYDLICDLVLEEDPEAEARLRAEQEAVSLAREERRAAALAHMRTRRTTMREANAALDRAWAKYRKVS